MQQISTQIDHHVTNALPNHAATIHTPCLAETFSKLCKLNKQSCRLQITESGQLQLQQYFTIPSINTHTTQNTSSLLFSACEDVVFASVSASEVPWACCNGRAISRMLPVH